MWIDRLISSRRKTSASNAAPQHHDDESSVAGVSKKREAAVRSMVAALRRSDFVEAKKYSYEEIRLKQLLNALKP